jgi:LCP family protein required for cell wall assembly
VNPPRPTLRAWTQRYVIALGVVFVLTVGGVVGANVVIDSKLADIQRVHLRTADLPGVAEAGNYLVIGSDTRSFVKDQADAQRFGSASEQGGQRSDTMMIVHVDPDSHKALVVSIPRDLVVDVPGVGKTRINAAFAQANSVQAGAQKVIDTLKDNFQLQIHHFVEVDFKSFRGVVNAIGTVHVYFPFAARDEKTGLSVSQPGCVALDGDGALNYVRSRYLEYLDPDTGKFKPAGDNSDIPRIQRQQEFIRRLGAVAFRKAVKNPITAKEVADAVVPNLTMDDQFGRSQIFGLVNLFREVDPSDPSQVEMTTFPNKPYGDGARLLPDQPAADAVVARLNQIGASSTTPQAPKPEPKQVRVRVLNGSGTNGLAAATLDALHRQFGFVVGEAGNWSEPLTETQVRYGSNGLAAATLVQSKLGGQGTLVPDSTINGTDVTVVLGSDFSAGGVTPTTSTTAAKSKTAKTTTTTAPADPAAACKP